MIIGEQIEMNASVYEVLALVHFVPKEFMLEDIESGEIIFVSADEKQIELNKKEAAFNSLLEYYEFEPEDKEDLKINQFFKATNINVEDWQNLMLIVADNIIEFEERLKVHFGEDEYQKLITRELEEKDKHLQKHLKKIFSLKGEQE
jgi:hypothetical protein